MSEMFCCISHGTVGRNDFHFIDIGGQILHTAGTFHGTYKNREIITECGHMIPEVQLPFVLSFRQLYIYT